MSYAEEDTEIAAKIAQWFCNKQIEVFNWLDPSQQGGRFLPEVEEAIKRADAFLALLSPSFLTSPWCRLERELALLREQDIQADEPTRYFINVVMVATTPAADTGFLRGYGRRNLVGVNDIEPTLTELWERISSHLRPSSNPPMIQTQVAIKDYDIGFRNRDSELDQISRNLRNPGGKHFWLVTAPPQLGKSWFARELCTRVKNEGWLTRVVDARGEQPEIRSDSSALLALLFDFKRPLTPDAETHRRIAQAISSTGRPHLCVLDSAELLNKSTAKELLASLIKIYQHVRTNGVEEVRLAVLVASRSDENWRGLTQSPRLADLTLTEFSRDVIRDALVDLAKGMRRNPFELVTDQVTADVHDVTEGLPALLFRCLQWIQDEQWYELSRLQPQDYFEALAGPYIKNGLLSLDSILPASGLTVDDQPASTSPPPAHVLEQACRLLARYRLITQSHLRHHLESDAELASALLAVGWSPEDLWTGISRAALLLRPLSEPWQEIHPAIRRLLYRYFYKTPQARAEAQVDAREFVEVWGEQQFGKEQVVGLIECLWHETMALQRGDSALLESTLTALADNLARELRPSPLYTNYELRQYAAQRMTADDEFVATIGRIDGLQRLFDRLIEIIESPPETPQ